MFEELRKTKIFHGLSDEAVNEIAGFTRRLEMKPGDVLFEDGSEDNHDLFLLLEGQLNVVKQYQTHNTPREMLLAPVDREVLGEVGWLNKLPRTAMSKAETPAVVAKIDGAALDDFFLRDPASGYQVMRNVASLLAQRLANTNSVVRMLLSNSV